MADAVKLALRGIERSYAQAGAALEILRGVDFSIKNSEIVALVAPSGAGKSTMLHICGLLEPADAGDISVCGIAATELKDRERTMLRRRHVGYIYQFHHLLPEFSAIENIMMPQLVAGVSGNLSRKNARNLLELMNLQDRSSHRPAQLSGGEQQRVAIARALVNAPGLVLADEPTGNLDHETSNIVFDLLARSIREHDAAGLIATHNHEIARRADRIVTLQDGELVPC